MHPTPRLAWLLGAGFPISLVPTVVHEALWWSWAAYALLALVLVLLDLLRIVPTGHVHLEVEVPHEVAVGESGTAVLQLAVRGQGATFTLYGDLDEELDPWEPRQVVVAPDAEVVLEMPLRAKRRGMHALRRVWLRWTGPFGLVAQTWSHGLDLPVHVVPDTRATRTVALRFFGSRALQSGLKVERFVGEGSEFDSLRAWVPGLDPRSVDWKASARHRRLLCRRFRAERNHQVIVGIDTGHLMSEPLSGVPRIDHAIERALALAYLCLRSGDRVGLYTFDAKPRTFIEPVSGVRAFARLRHASAAVEYGSGETNFALGILELTRRLRRRSLVVVFTEFADSVTAELMLDHIARLAKRHVILFVALRDPELQDLELAQPQRLSDVHVAVVTAGLRAERETVFERLRRHGVFVIDALPQEATVQLLNRYLDIKRRELV